MIRWGQHNKPRSPSCEHQRLIEIFAFKTFRSREAKRMRIGEYYNNRTQLLHNHTAPSGILFDPKHSKYNVCNVCKARNLTRGKRRRMVKEQVTETNLIRIGLNR
jgi:hypothetical protein